MNPHPNSLERALEEAVSRALRDNLGPLQRTADELHQAYADLVAACASTRPSNALPAMLRAQTAAAALAAGLSVLSNFVAVALNPRDAVTALADETAEAPVSDANASDIVDLPAAEPFVGHLSNQPSQVEIKLPTPEAPAEHETAAAQSGVPEVDELEAISVASQSEPESETKHEPDPHPQPERIFVETQTHVEDLAEPVQPAAPVAEAPAFNVAALPPDLQDLHRRASRVAKVAMQDIKLLRPKDVQSGREHKDLCVRLRVDLDKARKEYDRRFTAISDHPVDYFHDWMLEILAAGDREALGEYPYPSPVLRH